MTQANEASELGFDPDQVRARYEQERERRLREEGHRQYAPTNGAVTGQDLTDPYAKGDFSRESLKDDVEVLIIGGGFGGLMAAAELRMLGVEDVRIVEAASDFGGTWYWNRYPGAQCDIESYCYLPLLEETNYIPKEKYSHQPEIYAHIHRIAERFDLRERAIFRTLVTEVRWDDETKRWRVSTDRNDELNARFVVTVTGPSGRPKLPGIPGLATFEGKMFHTARWDYDYTGGDTTGGLSKLGDKRVALIGTGATAIQVVPHVGRAAKQLYVFQRTPSSVDVRGNRPTDPEWAASLKPGWQRERQENFNAITNGEPAEVDLVQDMWTDMMNYRDQPTAEKLVDQEAATKAEIADMRKMHQIRTRVDTIVKDPDTAEALKAWYPSYCKRPSFHDDYLPTFNLPNVKLIDTSASRGVERITPRGVVVAGVEYEVDCIIFATGFEISTGIGRVSGIPVIGRNDVTISDRWSGDLNTFHGHSVHGFPNWFFAGFSQNGISANYASALTAQVKHIAYIVNEVRVRGALSIEATRDAEREWVGTIRTLAEPLVRAFASCTPGYFNNEGQIAEEGKGRGLAGEMYAPGLNAFNRLLQAWRDKGDLEGMKLEMAATDSQCSVARSS
jgi:cyclohexanone monooxygenase